MQLRRSIIGERGLFLGTTSRKFDRILDRVILASDTHENYLPFWEYAAKAWNKIGVKPTLFLVENSDERVDIDESLGDVYRIRLPDQSMHSAFVSQCVRLLAPCLFPDENITLADIDMIPLSKEYFFNNLSQGDEDSFIEYRSRVVGDSEIAICWNVARGSTWSEIFDIKANVDNYQEVFLERLRQWNPNGYRPIYEELVASWFTDQSMLYKHVNNWSKNNSDKHVKLVDSQTGFCRLDHRTDGFSADLHDHYTDFCPRRPLQHNVDNIKHVLELYEII